MVAVRVRPLLIALVAILAIALAAATLNTAVAPDGSFGADGPGGLGDGSDLGEGGDEGDDVATPSVGLTGLGGVLPVIPLPCFPVLNSLGFLLAVATVGALGLYWLYRRDGPWTPVAVVIAFLPPALLVHALFTACRRADEVRLSLPGANRTANFSVNFGLAAGQGGGGAAAGGRPLLSLALVGFLAIALLVALATLFYSTGDDGAPPPATDEDDQAPDRMAAVGRAAGRAANRIERDAEADNAVYHAWREMTQYLDVPHPNASTPDEFATAAIQAGMAREDVEELTRLFEAVRYGGVAPTVDRERRAIAAFRRIETEYARDDG